MTLFTIHAIHKILAARMEIGIRVSQFLGNRINRYCEAYLLKLLLVLFSVTLLHVPFLGFGTAERNEALETLQIFMLVWNDRRR